MGEFTLNIKKCIQLGFWFMVLYDQILYYLDLVECDSLLVSHPEFPHNKCVVDGYACTCSSSAAKGWRESASLIRIHNTSHPPGCPPLSP